MDYSQIIIAYMKIIQIKNEFVKFSSAPVHFIAVILIKPIKIIRSFYLYCNATFLIRKASAWS